MVSHAYDRFERERVCDEATECGLGGEQNREMKQTQVSAPGRARMWLLAELHEREPVGDAKNRVPIRSTEQAQSQRRFVVAN